MTIEHNAFSEAVVILTWNTMIIRKSIVCRTNSVKYVPCPSTVLATHAALQVKGAHSFLYCDHQECLHDEIFHRDIHLIQTHSEEGNPKSFFFCCDVASCRGTVLCTPILLHYQRSCGIAQTYSMSLICSTLSHQTASYW